MKSIGTQSSEASEDIIRPQFFEESDEDMEESIARLALHGVQSLIISVVGTNLIQVSKPEQTAKRFAMPIAVTCLGMINLSIGKSLRMLQYGVVLHITTAGIVLNSYVHLLLINTRYISLAMIPVIMIVFIGALCRKFCVETCRKQLQHDSHGDSKFKASSVLRKSEEQLTLMVAMLPFWLQLPGVMLAAGTWQQDRVLVSHFLVFISSAMVALATLITRTVPARIYPGVSRVVPVMHKTCIVLILVSVHTMAGEWFGTKSMALACTPELVALLIWFSVHLNHAHGDTSMSTMTLDVAHVCNIICLGAVASWAWVATYDERTILQGYWSSFWGISGLSGGLCYFSSWILKQWPKGRFRRPTSDHHAPLLLQLLRFSAQISLFISVPSIALQLAPWVPSIYELLMSVATIMLDVLIYYACFLPPNSVEYRPGMSVNRRAASISIRLRTIMLLMLGILITHFTGRSRKNGSRASARR